MKKVVAGLRLGVPVSLAALALLAMAAAGTAAPVSKRSASDAGAITLGLPGIPPVFLGVRPYVASQKGFKEKPYFEAEAGSNKAATSAMANLAEAIHGLVGHMRTEQQMIRDWAESQAAQGREMHRLLERIAGDEPRKDEMRKTVR